MKVFYYLKISFTITLLFSGVQVYSQDSSAVAYVDYSQIKSTHPGIQHTHQEFLKRLDTAKAAHKTNLLALDTLPEKSAEQKKQLIREHLDQIKTLRQSYINEVQIYQNNIHYVIMNIKKENKYTKIEDLSKRVDQEGDDITELVMERLQ
ncbi:MAG: hypothetical protein ACOCUV_03745 [bacterium]